MNYSGLEKLCSGIGCVYSINEPMSKHTSFKIGGPADIFIEPENEKQLAALTGFINENETPRFFLGRGTNLLVSDSGFRGAVISVGKQFGDLSVFDKNKIACGAGTELSRLCMFALENSLSGLEFAYGIPGSVGGAVVMNAGAYGGEIKDVIVSATHVTPDAKPGMFDKEHLRLSYRNSIYINSGICVTGAVFSLEEWDRAEIKAKMDDVLSRRKSKQPLELPSAGSTFKRPVGGYASELIDRCGLKGRSAGGARVSEKHAGFVVNTGGATCKDVLDLIETIKSEVFCKTGIQLECEIIILGD